MADFNFSQDGSSPEFQGSVNKTHIGLKGTFGGGSVALEQKVNGTWHPVYDSGTAIAKTAPDDISVEFKPRDRFRLTLTGATSPDIDYSVNN